MLGLRGRMIVTAITAAAGALLVVLLLVGPRLRARAVDHARERLFDEARLAARLLQEPLARGAGIDELDQLMDEASEGGQARVTIIAPDGRVLADSAVSGVALVELETHGSRPEVQQALREGTGSSLRLSTTVGEELLYVAVLVEGRDGMLGISRVALSLEHVAAQARELEQAVAVALALAFGITAILTAMLSYPVIGPLNEIMEAAREFAAGNLSARIRVRRQDELGELARILNMSVNQLQDRLNENARDRARTEAILSSMEDGVLAVDHDGIVLVANDSLRQELGLEAPLGRHYTEVIEEKEVEALVEEVLQAAKRRADEIEIERLHRIYAVTGVSFPGASSSGPGAVLTFHDVTGRKRLDRIRRDFVANASHELRTPLTSVRGFVEALEDGAIDNETTSKRFLGKIRTHADRMASLVEDLLELSRLESGDRAPRWEEINPAEITQDIVASFASQAARHRIELQHTDGGAPPVVTDADRLRRALEALVDNAIKYTPEGGRVEIATSPAEDGGARLEVVDNGPGIPPEHLPRIFERFYRVDKARSRELGGTGLGLSIVKHLAEGMGASVSVTSVVGQGSRFSVSVPSGQEHLTGPFQLPLET
jgi:two-component system phosphate regulon sensor histidine kinase PhoR